VSNGCARLINEHIVDLYQRVPLNAPVILYPPAGQQFGA
jgi:lipoprotein-anchoring transpeptidase ErfK/SrfK